MYIATKSTPYIATKSIVGYTVRSTEYILANKFFSTGDKEQGVQVTPPGTTACAMSAPCRSEKPLVIRIVVFSQTLKRQVNTSVLGVTYRRTAFGRLAQHGPQLDVLDHETTMLGSSTPQLNPVKRSKCLG